MNLLTFEYSHDYVPSAPVVDVEIDGYRPELGTVSVSAFVDSGGDGTLIPQQILERIGADFQDEVYMSGTAGGRKRFLRYTVAIRLGQAQLGNIAAIAVTGIEVVLGRDVLNHFEVRLNGPAAVTEIVVG